MLANQQPTLDPIANPAAVNEDASVQVVNMLGISAGSGESQGIQITASSNNTALIATVSVNYSSPNAVGSLSYTPRPNVNGTATITVTVKDDGGTAGGGVDTLIRTFVVTVNAVNDAPVFSLVGNPGAVQEDSGTHTIAGFANGIGRGPATATDEVGQTLTFNTSITGTTGGLTFETPPTIDSSGTLTYKAAANANGTATMSVTLTDSGSGVAPNVNTSAPQVFTLTVSSINDPPSFSFESDPPASAVNSGLQTVPNFATDILPGASPDEANQLLTFDLVVLGKTGNLAFSQMPAINATTGTLTYQVAPNTQGTATVSATLYDNGLATPPNSNTSAALLFTITVTAFPWQASPNPLDVDEDGSVSGIDLIYIVEALNTPGDSFLPNRTPAPTKKVDVNGDNFISGFDLVLLVAALNTSPGLQMAPASAALTADAPSTEQADYAWSIGWPGSDDDEEVVALLAAAKVASSFDAESSAAQSAVLAASPSTYSVARRGSAKDAATTDAALDDEELID